MAALCAFHIYRIATRLCAVCITLLGVSELPQHKLLWWLLLLLPLLQPSSLPALPGWCGPASAAQRLSCIITCQVGRMHNAAVGVAPLTSEVQGAVLVACEVCTHPNQLQHTSRALTAHHLNRTGGRSRRSSRAVGQSTCI